MIVLGEAEGCIPFSTLVKENEKTSLSRDVISLENDVALLPYSSGTTGLPKPVMLSHYNIVANLCQLR